MDRMLFRAKHLASGEWVYGGFCVVHDGQGLGVPCIWEVGADKGQPIDDETVGQWTGLKDKNKVKIYEGDIIECWNEGVRAQGKVVRRIDGLWIIYPAYQKRIMWGLCPNKNGKTKVKIIGNIYDNPELLEKQEG